MTKGKKQEEVLISPYTAVRLFAKTYLNVGGVLLSDRRYKVTREAWIASMFLIALQDKFGMEWWFTPVRDDGSPDFNCYSFVEGEIGNSKELLKLEVFEWRKEVEEEDIVEAVKKIKLNKIVDPNITLLCYVRRNVVIPPATILKDKFANLNPKVKDIWYIGDVTPDSKEWRITQVFPNIVAIDLDYDKVLGTKEERSFITSSFGKTEGDKFKPTGKEVLLTPEFDIEVQ
ncbi:hypothetical protein [Candidatus Chazhemtobacterium aquaticus]|uniref:Uncharacterized protein n=1 Tax=Candidatus Chazhemtobacterium aquaticus TaxID=2715735 RepID=A0A857NCA1_9BACT|nr:hypothetical protein [Candidatus Chazhemtobacterium aquaticus]QHO63161.1 hypothetical protein MICH65_0180 [Candidatus Chazhemtobacterium aquaticus]